MIVYFVKVYFSNIFSSKEFFFCACPAPKSFRRPCYKFLEKGWPMPIQTDDIGPSQSMWGVLLSRTQMRKKSNSIVFTNPPYLPLKLQQSFSQWLPVPGPWKSTLLLSGGCPVMDTREASFIGHQTPWWWVGEVWWWRGSDCKLPPCSNQLARVGDQPSRDGPGLGWGSQGEVGQMLDQPSQVPQLPEASGLGIGEPD